MTVINNRSIGSYRRLEHVHKSCHVDQKSGFSPIDLETSSGETCLLWPSLLTAIDVRLAFPFNFQSSLATTELNDFESVVHAGTFVKKPLLTSVLMKIVELNGKIQDKFHATF